MKPLSAYILFTGLIMFFAFCTKGNGGIDNNSRPLVALEANLLSTNPFNFKFIASASDADNDPLTFAWDFGEGTKREGNSEENFTYAANSEYTVKVTVSDGKSAPVEQKVSITTTITLISLDSAIKYQTIEGFGGFGAKDVYWSSGPFTSPQFVSTIIDDLGLTILRDNIPTNFEVSNDNGDPDDTDLSKFNISNTTTGHDGKLADHLQYLKDMKEAGLSKLIVSVWSGPEWMKTNNRINNGTSQNAAPPYNPNPTSADNQLRTDMYEEFAEMCVAYIRIIKQETGMDVYALSLQNEPRFSQFYASCIFNGDALRDLLIVVGKRVRKENLNTKLFLPEDIGYLEGVSGMVQPTLNDPEARQYADIVAVHGYDLDGITANSPDAQTWQTMYNWGGQYNKPLWMTETSGFKNDWTGGMALAKAIYTALKFGNASAWLYWTLSTSKLDEYCLMSSSGVKSDRYYVSKNFYRYIRPGAVRIRAEADENSKIFPLAFTHSLNKETTVVLINDNNQARAIQLQGTGLFSQFTQYTTTSVDNCAGSGTVNSNDVILLKANSVTTLYHRN